jgi:hypothetical protein
VHTRDTDDEFGFENVSDLEIEELLACRDTDDVERERQQRRGLFVLGAKKRKMFYWHLKTLSEECTWRLGDVDMEQIWEATLDKIWRNVIDRNRFEVTGYLNAYIRWIMYCRTVDFLRRRVPIDPEIDVKKVEKRTGNRDEQPDAQIVRMLLSKIEKIGDLETLDEANCRLSSVTFGENEFLAIAHLLHLSLDGNAKLWPKDLADSVNIQRIDEGKPQLSVNAVRMALNRAVDKLPGKGDLE